MRIGFLGDGGWARAALDLILSDGDFSVAFVVPRFSAPDEALCDQASRAGVDVLRLANVNSPESLEHLGGHRADLLVSMSFDQIVKAGLLNLCPLGAVNCHAGALPFYRGRNVLNWALINDEPEFGVTVHYMDEGIDTGDIVLQRMSPISDDDTYATLLDRATTLCADTLYAAIRLLADGKADRVRQDSIHPVGFYTGGRREGDEWLDWTWSSRRLFNFVRAITTPGPCARSMLEGTEVRVVSVAMIPEAPTYLGTPGEVVGRSEHGPVVKTGDSTILVTGLDAGDLRPRLGHRFLAPAEARIRRLEQQVTYLRPRLADAEGARSQA